MAVAELNGRFLMANSAYQRMTGYTEAELLELTPLDLVIEADRPATRDGMSQLATGAVRQCQAEKRHRCKEGSVIWVRTTVSPIPGGPGLPRHVLAIAEDITERKRAEDELRNQKEILQKVFDHIPVMINFSGEDGRTKLVNREWERTIGWTFEEIQRGGIDVFSECYPDPQDRRAVMDFIDAAQGGWVDFKPRVRDGRTLDTRWAEVRLSDGTTIGIGMDVTERKRTEEALCESEQRLRQLAEHIREVLWMIDLKTQRMLYVNPSYERIWGRTCESLYCDPRSFMDAIHPEDRPRVLNHYEAQIRNQIPIEISYRLIRPDGSMRWICDRSYPVRDSAGEVYRFVGTAQNITERKRTEEHLRRSEAYLSESERLSHIGTWAMNIPSREIAFWSKEHYRIFGFDPGKSPPTVEAALARIHPGDSAVRETITLMLGEAKDFEVDFRLVLPDGSIRHVRSLGHPILNDAGELVEFVGMAMDVTERKLVEDALQRSLKQLRALAAKVERVREEERTRMAREIHDELGQALTGIKIDVSSLLHHPPARPQERAERCQGILERADDAIRSVRRISTELRPGVLDDLGLVAALEWAAQEFARRTGTKCALELPCEDVAIKPGVATALFRIFQEALSNIARHAEATEFSVRLAESDGGLSLDVRDNGRGFHEAQISNGESLGIMGMRERALLLNGRLTIRSSPGEGATISVWIPAWRNRGAAK
jgi:PAS domain S-box-containing protein